MKYILGLDIAWCIGIAIYDLEENRFIYIESIDANNIKLKAKEKREKILEHGKRLRYILNEFKPIVEKYPPSLVFIERYFSRFANSTIALAKIHGVINELLADIPTVYYPPKTVKEALLNGDAKKDDLQDIIKAKYDYITFNNDDESDAVAVTICGLIKENLIEYEKPELPKKEITKKKKMS